MIQENLKKKINRLSFVYSQVAFEKKKLFKYTTIFLFLLDRYIILLLLK